MEYTLQQIASITRAKLRGKPDEKINKIIIDSRHVVDPTGTLFIAIKGIRNDGHFFIHDLIKKRNIRNFIVASNYQIPNEYSDFNFIIVDNPLYAFHALAADYRSRFNIPIIGITGSNGKTIVKEWLYHILQPYYRITRSPKSYNSQTGVPLSVLNLEPDTTLAIFEAGISQKNEMQNLSRIIQPTIGIFTNIGDAHQENFIDYEEKIVEKLLLFKSCDTLIFCADHELIDKVIKNTSWLNSCRKLTWSTKNKEADLRISAIEQQKGTTRITGLFQKQLISITIPFTDYASIENAIHCWITALYLQIPQSEIQQAMNTLTPVAMRLEQIAGINGCTIINDSYNLDIPSLTIALDYLMQQQHPNKTLILSDILQSGLPDNELYKRVASLINEKKINKLYGIGRSIYSHADLFSCEKEFFKSTDEFIDSFHASKFQNEAILLKGARIFEFERILAMLEQRVHLTTLEINLNALVHNLNYYRSKLKPETKIMVMVKAFSYGSGSYEIANLLEFHRVNYLAVAYVDEGIALRRSNIALPIIVMGPEDGSFRRMIEYQLEPEIYSFDVLQKFMQQIKIHQLQHIPIHIKIDTGMHRLGFLPDEITSLCHILKDNHLVQVKSVFSHLAASDEPEHDDYTHQQVETFVEVCKQIQSVLPYQFDRHILNSAGIERFPQYQFDMVRLGIGLYGINPFNQNKLKVVGRLKTHIIQIKHIKKGNTIGYGRKGMANKDTTIAVIPIGYADGFTRRLSGKGKVWLNGKYAPIIGNICMDMSMIDITNIQASVGDEVEIFGEHISVDELASITGTIAYEILTSVSDRVKRIYISE